MVWKPYSSLIRRALVGAALAALIAPSLWAHIRPYPHRHRKPHSLKGAVIVIGEARPLQHQVVLHGRPAGYLDMSIKPKTTEVWVDGKFRGIVDDFDGRPEKLRIRGGDHRLKLVTPDGTVIQRGIHITPGTEVKVKLDLRD